MIKIIAIVATIFMACATSKYDRALKNCNTKCYPQVAVGVDYNYNNNRYDKCVCKTEDDARKMK
jgi:hypothetical protein